MRSRVAVEVRAVTSHEFLLGRRSHGYDGRGGGVFHLRRDVPARQHQLQQVAVVVTCTASHRSVAPPGVCPYNKVKGVLVGGTNPRFEFQLKKEGGIRKLINPTRFNFSIFIIVFGALILPASVLSLWGSHATWFSIIIFLMCSEL
ncbi:hypothetical protein Ahy_B08g094298 isoform A [Arachis hypogaea]|uniref:Uncharacterized protein n=1 Tax=Arachis hypogaea TaxID=3818 RepID=A0A444Y8L1_ARAHY|nr:hypothetical protein Ahy_B08g094298 isoform A [Arachis hypogaea]